MSMVCAVRLKSLFIFGDRWIATQFLGRFNHLLFVDIGCRWSSNRFLLLQGNRNGIHQCVCVGAEYNGIGGSSHFLYANRWIDGRLNGRRRCHWCLPGDDYRCRRFYSWFADFYCLLIGRLLLQLQLNFLRGEDDGRFAGGVGHWGNCKCKRN